MKKMDLTTGRLTAFTEVERRQSYLDKMTDEMEMLKPLVVSCLDDDPSKRLSMIDIITTYLDPLKVVSVYCYFFLLRVYIS